MREIGCCQLAVYIVHVYPLWEFCRFPLTRKIFIKKKKKKTKTNKQKQKQTIYYIAVHIMTFIYKTLPHKQTTNQRNSLTWVITHLPSELRKTNTLVINTSSSILTHVVTFWRRKKN